ncbi:GNAT family N-acetyltransferase [Marinobacter salarius]|jgi:CelD/BcsL family acetyltransferase involved in cellulose biosynthesis|uniref:GNAT family N-acetyltransferase n=1 Tax=Marinobacter salarius TaxID=1420917 RepID=UPI003BACCAEF
MESHQSSNHQVGMDVDPSIDSSCNFSIQTVSDPECFLELEDDWQQLSSDTHAGGAVPLPLTSVWMLSWWKGFSDGARLRLTIIRQHGRIIAIAPLAAVNDHYRRISVKKTKFLSNGHTPFCDILFAPDVEYGVRKNIMRELIKHLDYDLIELRGIKEKGSTHQLLIEVAQSMGIRVAVYPALSTPVVNTKGDWDAFLAEKSKKFRQRVRSTTNRFERSGGKIEKTMIKSGEDSIVEEMITVSSHSWKRSMGTDLGSRADSVRFLKSLFDQLGPRKSISVWMARTDSGEPIAFELHLIWGGVSYPIRADFNEQYKKLSPGFIAELNALRSLFEQADGTTYYSCADDYQYLSHWTDTYAQHVTVELFKPGLKGFLLYNLEYRLIPVLRSIRSVFRKETGSESKTSRPNKIA